ncbi:3-keto-disaccharide hydrolase [Paludisphaera rhizosphaerae]|uniref:3-keto-disaccharide hydrolase n=1 Tax=Paludisphaera rhizosphaerae TaxID=2711216 RepID=UPI0013ECA0C7|nr:DUF1080 domain-containing protein [Paludisphaera rhizosphaerae]
MTFRKPSLSISATLAAALLVPALTFAGDDAKSIFDGSTPKGWQLTNGKPLPEKFIQDGAINPHGTGSYIVVYEEKLGDFVADFDYKLSAKCNSGVFVRVNNLKDPVNTGLEIAIDDTTGKGLHDSGAVYDLVAPKSNAQKPVGEWNHMTITAKGPSIKVQINGTEVTTINLDEFNEVGKRADGSDHKFKKVAIGKLDRTGWFGFQDHGQDCWYKNITIKQP